MRLSGYPKFIIKRFKATVINDIWPELVFFSLVATMVTLVSKTKYNLGISPQMLTVLGTVLGLVVSFRTSSAYDRYWEGRKLWSSIELSSRQMAQIIWIHVPIDRKADPAKPQLSEDESRARAIIEKRSMINLVQAFSVSMKHFLRSEEGIYYQDLYPLICFLPRYVDAGPDGKRTQDPSSSQTSAGGNGTVGAAGTQWTAVGSDELPLWYESPLKKKKYKPSSKPKRQRTFDPEKVLPTVESDIPLRPARLPPKFSIWALFPFLLPFRWVAKKLSRRVRERILREGDERTISGKVKKPAKVESNVPLEVTLYLSSYLAFLLKNGLLQAALATAYANQLQSFQDCMTAMERVRNTPIPFAYQVHLRMSIWIYLFLLPFEVYSSFKWLTIPMTLFASFLILGFLEIGQEIENPFSYEANDLDLDGFCLEIQRELHEITAHAVRDPSEYIFSDYNQPFAPCDRDNASTIIGSKKYASQQGMGTLRRTLLHNWQQVSESTRDTEL